jgi:hypothetical protein
MRDQIFKGLPVAPGQKEMVATNTLNGERLLVEGTVGSPELDGNGVELVPSECDGNLDKGEVTFSGGKLLV